MIGARGGPSVGVVGSFDTERGLGTVTTSEGVTLAFHCTAVADGSRLIAPGTPVAFVVAPGVLGRLEARRLVALGQPGEAPDPLGPPGGAASLAAASSCT